MYKHCRRAFATAMLSLLSFAVPCWSLPMGEPQAAHFTRELTRIVNEILRFDSTASGNSVDFDLSGKTIRDTEIKSATISFHGYSAAMIKNMQETGFTVSDITAGDSIDAQATISATAINSLIRREISRLKPGNRILDRLAITFLDNQVKVEGLVDFRKIPGNVLAFMVTDFSPFTATLSVESSGSLINLNIVDATVNGQPMTPELRTQIHSWMNPVWDFSILPYRAEVDSYAISPAGINFRGSISQ